MSSPGLPRGKRCRAVVELVDLHPTLSELAGLPIHTGAEGESFVFSVTNPDAPGQTVALSQFPKGGFMGYTIRNSTHRYTEWRKSEAVVHRELYEYDKDGVEKVNLADQPGHADLQERLSHLLRDQ